MKFNEIIPWRIRNQLNIWLENHVRPSAPKLYKLIKFGRTNINTPDYWNNEWENDSCQRNYEELFSLILGHIPEQAKVIDVGCGVGRLSKLIKQQRNAELTCLDFSSWACDQLKKDGFNVIKDKENIGYKGVISKFMNEIGNADFVIVAISDKYLKSKFCMYELFEIFRNSGMNREEFGKKIFPIRIEETLNLSDPDVVNGYVRYWKEQEQEWTKRVKEESDSITEEQARQYQFIKRLVIDIRNILSCLADINSLNLSTLKSNDFADVKSALRESMEVK